MFEPLSHNSFCFSNPFVLLREYSTLSPLSYHGLLRDIVERQPFPLVLVSGGQKALKGPLEHPQWMGITADTKVLLPATSDDNTACRSSSQRPE